MWTNNLHAHGYIYKIIRSIGVGIYLNGVEGWTCIDFGVFFCKFCVIFNLKNDQYLWTMKAKITQKYDNISTLFLVHIPTGPEGRAIAPPPPALQKFIQYIIFFTFYKLKSTQNIYPLPPPPSHISLRHFNYEIFKTFFVLTDLVTRSASRTILSHLLLDRRWINTNGSQTAGTR